MTVQLGLKEQLEQLEVQEHQANRDHWDRLGLPVPLEQVDLQDAPVPLVQVEPLVCLVELVLQDQLVHRE